VIGRDLGLVILILVSFLMGISNSLAMSFEGIYVKFLGGGNSLVGLMIGVAGVSEIPSMHFGQKITGRIKGSNALILSLGLMGCAYVGYVLARDPRALIAMAVFKGLGFGLFFSNIVPLVNARAPEDWVTTAQSLRAVAMFGVAPLLAGPLGGTILDLVSPSAIFLVSCFTLGLAAILVGVAKFKLILD